MKIFYGILENMIDVTDICLGKLMNDNIITIPSGDHNRSHYFTDPIIGVVKTIFIENNGIRTEYYIYMKVKFNIISGEVDIEYDINYKIQLIQSKLKIKYGNFNEELPEQKMVASYLTGNEKVLEIGGNIGRNTLIIAFILGNNSNNLVTLECDTNIAKQLTENRELNNLNFHIENSALSNRKLIQKNWDTMPSEILLDGFKWVNTISLEKLKTKYNICFDTLVLDCEGAFYYILMDMPEILNNINLIIMENDYHNIVHKEYIDEILVKNNFKRVYVEGGGWGPCYNNFFEVWKLDV